MEDDSNEERIRMEEWVKETEERRRRRPRDHQMSKAEVEEIQKSPGFQSRLSVGKSSEAYVSEKLSIIRFTVKDISEETFGTERGEFHSPFDLLASSQFFQFVADVKRRNYRVPIGVPVKKLDDYKLYDKYDAREDKLVIFHFPRVRHQDCFFITVKDIRERCHIVGPFYHIEMQMLIPLTAKALINTLEDRSGCG